MTSFARRALVLGFAAAVPVLGARAAFAVDALPDARFVGYAQQIWANGYGGRSSPRFPEHEPPALSAAGGQACGRAPA